MLPLADVPLHRQIAHILLPRQPLPTIMLHSTLASVSTIDPTVQAAPRVCDDHEPGAVHMGTTPALAVKRADCTASRRSDIVHIIVNGVYPDYFTRGHYDCRYTGRHENRLHRRSPEDGAFVGVRVATRLFGCEPEPGDWTRAEEKIRGYANNCYSSVFAWRMVLSSFPTARIEK